MYRILKIKYFHKINLFLYLENYTGKKNILKWTVKYYQAFIYWKLLYEISAPQRRMGFDIIY